MVSNTLDNICDMISHRPNEFSYDILRTLSPADQVTTLSTWIAKRTSRHCTWMEAQVPTGYEKILEEFWHTQLTKAHEASEAYFYTRSKDWHRCTKNTIAVISFRK